MIGRLFFFLWLICFACGVARADLFLNLTSVTPGGVGVGAFSGDLGGIAVTGMISGPFTSFSFNGVGGGINDSTIDGSSPQYSYASVFSPITGTLPTGTDRVGWNDGLAVGGVTNFVTLIFSSPVTNPVIHVANMDVAQFGFAGTTGLTSLTLLNGNGGSGDGFDPLGLTNPGKFIQDAAPGTSDATFPGGTPPLSGARSAYGSVQLNGTFSDLTFGVGVNGPGIDVGGGSFTLSATAVPEPSSMLLVGLSAMGLAGFTKRRVRSERS